MHFINGRSQYVPNFISEVLMKIVIITKVDIQNPPPPELDYKKVYSSFDRKVEAPFFTNILGFLVYFQCF